MRTCFLLENDATVDLLVKDGGFEPGRDLVVCWNYLPYLKLSSLGLPGVFFVEDFFSKEDYRRLHIACDAMAAAWHTEGGRDLLLHEGVPFGTSAEIALFRYYYQNVLVKLGCLVATVKRRHPDLDRLVHDFSNSSNAFHHWVNDERHVFDKEALLGHVSIALNLAEARLVPLRFIPPASCATMTRGERPFLTLSFRLLGAVLTALNRFKPSMSDGAIYYFQYFNQASLGKAFTGSAISSGLRLDNALSSTRFLDFDLVHAPLTEADRHFLDGLVEQAEALSPARNPAAYVHDGLDFAPFFALACRDILETHLPRLVRYARRVRTGLAKYHITQLVANDLMTERGKTLAAVCRSSNVELVFVDHGIQPLRHVHACSMAFEPDLIIKPDSFDSTSEPYPYGLTASAVQLGNPCTDPYVPATQGRLARLETVLVHTFADNFYARLDRISAQERYYAELLPALRELLNMGLKVVYRPHNENQAYHDYMFDSFCLDKSRLVASTWKKPFRELIREVDLLVCNVSTTFYEALAAGVPAVFFDPSFDPESFFPPITGPNFDEVVRVTSGRELVELVSRNRQDASELRNWLDHFLSQHAPRYLGPLDGGAGRRIGKFLENRNRA